MKKNSKRQKLSMLKRVCADLGQKPQPKSIIPPGVDPEMDYWEYVGDQEAAARTVTTVPELMKNPPKSC